MDKILVDTNDKNYTIVLRNEDRTCEIESKGHGMYKGYIESMTSSGRYIIKILEVLREEQPTWQ
jgi:hypothetical protein